MSFYMETMDMLKDFGNDIKVWDASKFKPGKIVAGVPQKVALTDDNAEKLHEPVYPANNSQMVSFLPGGNELQADLIWLSNHKYPKDTVVEVPNLGGRFKVTGINNWQDYSDLIIYTLKGDDQHQ